MKNSNLRIIKSASVLIALISFLLLSTASINGLGVSPAFKTVNFQPNSTLELEFEIINSEQNTFEATLSVLGELKSIIFLEKPVVQICSENYRNPFKIMLKFPSEMEPGIHGSSLQVNPSLPNSETNIIAAYITPQIPIYVRVPYPSKYADVSLAVVPVDEGTPVPIFVQFDNMGSEEILKAGAQVEVYAPSGKLLSTLSTIETNVLKNSLGKVQAEPDLVLKRGVYSATAKAYYDGINKTITANFTIGEPRIRIMKLVTRELLPGQINRIIFKARNEWNTALSSAGYVQISNKQNEMPVFQLQEGEEKEIEGFIDTTGLALGEQSMNITLVYASQMRTDTFAVNIVEKAIKIPKLSWAWLIILIITLIAIGVLVFIIIKRKKALKAQQENKTNETFK